MMDKRLLGLVPEAMRHVLLNVLWQWVTLLANAVIVYVTCRLLAGIVGVGATPGAASLMVCAVAIVVRLVATKLAADQSFAASYDVKRILRRRIYEKVLALGPRYAEQIPTAEVVQLAVEGTEQLETYFGQYLPQLFYAVLAPLTLFGMLVPISLTAAVVLLIFVPLIPVVIVIIQKIAKRILGAYWDEYANLADNFLENLQGLSTLKIYGADAARHERMDAEAEHFRVVTMKVLTMQLNSIIVMDVVALGGAAAGLSGYVLDGLRGLAEVLQFGAGERYLSEMDRRSRELVDDQRRIASVSGMAGAAVGALITCFSLAVLALGMRLQAAGEAEAYDVVVATVALMSSFGSVVALANLGTGLQATLASGARVLDILEEEPQVNEVAEGATPAFSVVRAADVRFSYAGANGTREQVLDGVSLTVPQGSIVGISGKSGSGKSTLLRLLMRFWDVDAGEVRVSDEPIASIATSHLRSLEALVEQDTYLFHDSIRDNLLVAKPDATQAELEAACRAASVHEFIAALPQGYDSMVGELGDTLSGGERQRLGLARAFLHDAPFLLLDEPTSNLDSLNEGIILKSLAAQRGERTVLLISHRASTMGIADESYAMDEGRVS